jgi:transcriptional/translational regulatory protein YebC/TACO1
MPEQVLESPKVKYPQVKVKLAGQDGNAFVILGLCLRAARSANVPKEEIDKFREEATNGDYNHLLRTCMEWWDVR